MRATLVSLAGISAMSNALGLASSLFVLHVYDRVLTTRSGLALVLLAAVFGAMVVVAGVLDALRARALVRIANRMEAGEAGTLARALGTAQPLDAGDRPLERMGATRAALASPAAGALFDALWTPIFVLTAFLLHPALGWTVLACAAALIGLVWAGHRLTHPAQEAARSAAEAERQATGGIGMVMPGYRLAGAQERLARRWHDERLGAIAALMRGTDGAVALMHASRTLRGLVQILVLAMAAWLAVRQEVTLGGVFAASILAARALLPVEILASNWALARDALDALRRAARWRGPAPLGGIAPEAAEAPVRVLRASHAVLARDGDVPALAGIDIAVGRGEVMGIMGPPGAGKSALLALLTGLARPSAGTVRLDDVDPASRAAAAMPVRIGYLEQTPAFLPGTLAQNIARGDASDLDAMRDACSRAGLMPLLSRLREGLDTHIDAEGRPLSPGERRLVALARALYGRPQILALDLPETEIGPDGETAVARAMADTAQAGGIVLVASHSPRLMRYATRIALLSEGRIVRTLSPQELLGVLREERRETARTA